MSEFLTRAIESTRETIAVANEGLALDAKRDYYEPAKRKMVEKILKQAEARLAALLRMEGKG